MNRTFIGFIILLFVIILSAAALGQGRLESRVPDTSQVTLLIRCDDWGMNHAVNMAAEQVVKSGIPVSASVMFACPWYQEAVELLKTHPEVSVGVHLTLNAEWKNYRWGPVAGASTVPTLVDSLGFFFPSRELLFRNNPRLDEIERELRAQIDRAVHSGLRVDYVDYHMGAAMQTLATRAIVEKLAAEYGLGISRYFGERDVSGVYAAPPDRKRDTLIAVTRELKPGGINLLVFHIGVDTPEMNALEDLNSFGLKEMSRHRRAELDALISSQFQDHLRNPRYRLTTYGKIKEGWGLDAMQRPEVRP